MMKKTLLVLLTISGLLAVLATCAPAQPPQAETAADLERKVFQFKKSERDSAPLSLTAADGNGLELKSFRARAVLQGPLAFTELRLTFANPENRVREGRFRITLPERAAISRLAMRIDDVWQEAEVVEKQAARVAYEDFLHRRQDPALMEKSAGNEFQARIFPIPAGGEKELIISYSQELESSSIPYTLHLQGLPTVADFEIEVQSRAGEKPLILKHAQFQPQGDFQLSRPDGPSALASRKFLVARVAPELDATPQNPKNLLVLVDTSASRGLGLERQLTLLKGVVSRIPGLSRVEVAGFDQSVFPVYRGKPDDLKLNSLADRGALGATDLKKALAWATSKKGYDRLLIITDGIVTAGEDALTGNWQSSGIERIDVLLSGGIRDRDRMLTLVQGPSGKDGVVLSADLPVSALVKSLTSSVSSGVPVRVEGAGWTWPSTLDNLQPGEERLIYAEISAPSDTYSLQVGETTFEVRPLPLDESPLLERSAVVAKISRLESVLEEETDPEKKDALSRQILDLSTTHRVLSSKTALLVLETDADYERFGIDRTALSDILTVSEDGLALVSRNQVHLPPTPVATITKESDDKDKRAVLTESTEDEFKHGSAQDLSPSTANSAPRTSVEEEAPSPPPGSEGSALYHSRPAPAAQVQNRQVSGLLEREEAPPERKAEPGPPPISGKFAEIKRLLTTGSGRAALQMARQWQQDEPGNVLGLIALGDCLEKLGRNQEAARVFGSIIDLYPSRADLRRYAASRLQSLGEHGLELAVDCFQKAADQRPDHVSSHRFLAFAQARQGRFKEAMDSLERGLSRSYPSGRFRSYERILKDDLGLLAAAWLKTRPQDKNEVYDHLKKYDARMATEPSLRFILTWETDANDVDFHIRDSLGGHAYYSEPKLASGGELYGDVTTGYGPECFAIEGEKRAYPYQLQIHYYSRGPMGYGMGQLEVLQHDGHGNLTFEERPYVVMEDGAYVDLGEVEL